MKVGFIRTLFMSFFSLISLNVYSFDHAHVQWEMVLKTHVQVVRGESRVNYTALKQAPVVLINYLKSLEKLSEKKFKTFSQKQKLAFWINAYNAYTIKLVLSKYPVESIKDIGTLFQGPWSKKFIPLFDKIYSLDDIEHKIIRKDFSEPRIHFAVNCASIGCPSLFPDAFIAPLLDIQLEKATRLFLLNKTKNELKGKTLLLSKIFDWYGGDFKKSHGSLLTFIEKYISLPEEVEITFRSYDWKLNKL